MNGQHPPIEVKVNCGDGRPHGHKLKPIRIFKLKEPSSLLLALCGYDFDDHDLWVLNTANHVAHLIGSLKEPGYKKMRKVRHTSLDEGQFDHVSKRALKELSLKLPLAADYVESMVTTSFTTDVLD